MPDAIRQSRGEVAGRIIIYAVLLFFAVYFLVPLFVMVTTSVKTMDEIRTGTLIALPHQPTLEPWLKAWGYATIGAFSGTPSAW
jgi:glucose/mannose transport system permease protein